MSGHLTHVEFYCRLKFAYHEAGHTKENEEIHVGCFLKLPPSILIVKSSEKLHLVSVDLNINDWLKKRLGMSRHISIDAADLNL